VGVPCSASRATLTRNRPCIGIGVAEIARPEQGISGFKDKLQEITAAANALNLFLLGGS